MSKHTSGLSEDALDLLHACKQAEAAIDAYAGGPSSAEHIRNNSEKAARELQTAFVTLRKAIAKAEGARPVLSWSEACDKTASDWCNGRERGVYEITEEAYWWGLECVPPAVQRSGGFLCGEPYTHDKDGNAVYDGGASLDGKFYAIGLMTIAEFRKFSASDLRLAIAKSEGQA